MSSPSPQPWVTKILETIADSSPLREGLKDDEAQPLIDWGTKCAEHLGQRLAASGTPAPEQVESTAYNLTRLMTRINWLATYRQKKDAVWLTRTFQMVNQLNRELFGDDAPVMSAEEITAWLAEHARLTNAEVVQNLIARFSPSAVAAPSAPSAPPGVIPAPVLPGRDTPEPTPPAAPGAILGHELPRQDAPEPTPPAAPGAILGHGLPRQDAPEPTPPAAPGVRQGLGLPRRAAPEPTPPAAPGVRQGLGLPRRAAPEPTPPAPAEPPSSQESSPSGEEHDQPKQ